MSRFTVIEGRQSPHYNHFAEYELASCRATKTRLMGVVAIKTMWKSPDNPSRRYYQIMHLDYSEYGIDEYLEFECIPGNDNYAEVKEAVKENWNSFITSMGGAPVNIKPACMLRLIDSALELAGDNIAREYDTDENREFRQFANERLDLMRAALKDRGISSDECNVYEALDAVCESELGQYATINYFLMRLVDRDFEAATFLSEIPEETLRESPLTAPGIQTLMRNSITRESKKDNPKRNDKLRMYTCRLTTLAANGYYHAALSIWLDGGRTSRDALVMDMEVGSIMSLSGYESAVQIAQPEYITVFDCKDSMLKGFDGRQISPMASALPTPCENGWLFTMYNKTNAHVERSEYRMGDDVYGYALLSIGGELILMSHDLSRITVMDDATLFSIYSPFITAKGRYRLDNPVFHTLCHTPGIYFDDLVEPDE